MFCSSLCFAKDQKVAIVVLRSGLKTFASAVSTTDPIRPLSACILSVDSNEDFSSIQAFRKNNVFLIASNKRIVILKWHETKLLESVDNICVFPNDPLISMCIRNNMVFCLGERGVSMLLLADSTQKQNENDSQVIEEIQTNGVEGNPQKKKISAIAISKTPAKKQTYELAPVNPTFKDLVTLPGSSDSTQRISLPFDSGRIRRIYYDQKSDRILIGGEILNIMTNSEGRYKIKEERVHNSYFACCSTPSGYIFLNDWVSNDLVMIDTKYKEVNRYKGVPDQDPVESENLKYIQQSKNCLLWLAGPAKVIRINYDMTMDEVSLFDQTFVDQYNPAIQIIQGTVDDCYYMTAVLENRGSSIIVCGKESTHVVPLSNIGGESKLWFT